MSLTSAQAQKDLCCDSQAVTVPRSCTRRLPCAVTTCPCSSLCIKVVIDISGITHLSFLTTGRETKRHSPRVSPQPSPPPVGTTHPGALNAPNSAPLSRQDLCFHTVTVVGYALWLDAFCSSRCGRCLSPLMQVAQAGWLCRSSRRSCCTYRTCCARVPDDLLANFA